MKQPPSTMLRMGTFNVRSLSGRKGGVLDLANLHALHVMCLQPLDSFAPAADAHERGGDHSEW